MSPTQGDSSVSLRTHSLRSFRCPPLQRLAVLVRSTLPYSRWALDPATKSLSPTSPLALPLPRYWPSEQGPYSLMWTQRVLVWIEKGYWPLSTKRQGPSSPFTYMAKTPEALTSLGYQL